MTDAEAIAIAKRYAERRRLPVVHIPPYGVIDEITTVDLRNPDRPIVTRRPSPIVGAGKEP